MGGDPESVVADHRPLDLSGKVGLVTGGNSGIGLAAAAAWARAGAAVAIWGRRADRNEAAAKALGAVSSHEVLVDSVDVADDEAVRSGFARLLDHRGRVDCVFVNAGIADHRASFLAITPESRTDVFNTNLLGAWSTIEVALRHMVDRASAGDPGGSIVVNGSVAATRGLSGGEAYAAAKAALGAIVRGIAVGYGRHGVRANMVCPGFIERDGEPGRLADVVAASGPLPRYGRPSEVAGVVTYLASDAASYHTGDTLMVDGGWSIRVL